MANTITHYGQLAELLGLIELKLIADTANHTTLPLYEYTEPLEEQSPNLTRAQISEIELGLGKLEEAVLAILGGKRPAGTSGIGIPEDIRKFLEDQRENYKKKVEEDTKQYKGTLEESAKELSGLFGLGHEYRFATPKICFHNSLTGYYQDDRTLVFFTHKPLNTRYVIGEMVGEWLYSLANTEVFNEVASAQKSDFRKMKFNMPAEQSIISKRSFNGRNLIDFIKHYCGLSYSDGEEDIPKHLVDYNPLVAARELYTNGSADDFKEIVKLPLEEALSRIQELTGIDLSSKQV